MLCQWPSVVYAVNQQLLSAGSGSGLLITLPVQSMRAAAWAKRMIAMFQ